MQLDLSIHPNCLLLGNAHYHVRAQLPLHAVDVITKIATEARCAMFHGISSVGDLDVDVFEYFLDDETGKVSWLGCSIDGVGISFTVLQEGIRMDMSPLKEAEGMDRFDDFAFIGRMSGKLPGNYWIRPAKIIRTLLAQIQH